MSMSTWSKVKTYFCLPFTRNQCLLGLGVVLLVIQFSQILFILSHVADSRAVIRAFDDDAGNAIDVAQRSPWYKDNGFSGYGNLYFRLANTLGATLTEFHEPHDLGPIEAESRRFHFALLMVSAFAMYLLAAALAWSLGSSVAALPASTAALVWAFLYSPVWQQFLVRAHPDLLLAFFIILASILSTKSWNAPEDKLLFRYSAWVWGLALATKMSVILYLPFVVLTHMCGASRAQLKRAALFGAHLLAAYFLVGFPQNFNIPRTIRFLTYQSQYSTAPTMDSLIDWLTIWGEQVYLPLIVILVLLTLIRPSFPKMNRPFLIRALILAIGPFVLILTQNIMPSHGHYMIPVVAGQLVLLALYFRFNRSRSSPTRHSNILIFSIALLSFLIFGVLPKSFDSTIKNQLTCREEARRTFSQIKVLSDAGRKIFATPYSPVNNKMPGIRSIWHPTREYIVEGDFNVVTLNRNRVATFFHDSSTAYLSVSNPHLNETQLFYSLFQEGDAFNDTIIGNWHRTYQDDCQWDIWQKVE